MNRSGFFIERVEGGLRLGGESHLALSNEERRGSKPTLSPKPGSESMGPSSRKVTPSARIRRGDNGVIFAGEVSFRKLSPIVLGDIHEPVNRSRFGASGR